MALSERVRVRRGHTKASYDEKLIHRILDASPVCHVGCIRNGIPVVTPTTHWRMGNRLYWHGSTASSSLRAQTHEDVCITVTHFDGFVAARSAFHHSANYRSVMMFGRPDAVESPEEKESVLQAFMESLFPDRWTTLRPMTDQELKATALLWMPINEVSAKVRTGPPVDNDEDLDWPVWAGIVPYEGQFKPPKAVSEAHDAFDVPALNARFLISAGCAPD